MSSKLVLSGCEKKQDISDYINDVELKSWISDDGVVYNSDVQDYIDLDLTSFGPSESPGHVRDISGLEYFIDLQTLYLEDVYSLEPIKDLSKLSYLVLTYTEETNSDDIDLSFLADMESLSYLRLCIDSSLPTTNMLPVFQDVDVDVYIDCEW